MVFINRSRRGPDRFLSWKLMLFFVSGLLIYFGIRLELRWVLWVAILLLLVAVGLRLFPAKNRETEEEDRGT